MLKLLFVFLLDFKSRRLGFLTVSAIISHLAHDAIRRGFLIIPAIPSVTEAYNTEPITYVTYILMLWLWSIFLAYCLRTWCHREEPTSLRCGKDAVSV